MDNDMKKVVDLHKKLTEIFKKSELMMYKYYILSQVLN